MTGMRWTEEQLAEHRRRAVVYGSKGEPIPNAPAKPRKYRNQPVTEDGITFDSKKEAQEYRALRLRLRAGEIQCLARQVSFWLPGGIEYRADFVYLELSSAHSALRRLVVKDVKSPATRKLPAYVMKKKLMASIGYEITEV